MKKITLIYTGLFLIILALNFTVDAQNKKPAEKPKGEDKLKLTEQEGAALDGLIREDQKRQAELAKREGELADKSISDDRTLFLVEKWRSIKAEIATGGETLTSWWQAVRNRADCQDCALNQQERRLIKPEPKPEAKTAAK